MSAYMIEGVVKFLFIDAQLVMYAWWNVSVWGINK